MGIVLFLGLPGLGFYLTLVAIASFFEWVGKRNPTTESVARNTPGLDISGQPY